MWDSSGRSNLTAGTERYRHTIVVEDLDITGPPNGFFTRSIKKGKKKKTMPDGNKKKRKEKKEEEEENIAIPLLNMLPTHPLRSKRVSSIFLQDKFYSLRKRSRVGRREIGRCRPVLDRSHLTLLCFRLPKNKERKEKEESRNADSLLPIIFPDTFKRYFFHATFWNVANRKLISNIKHATNDRTRSSKILIYNDCLMHILLTTVFLYDIIFDCDSVFQQDAGLSHVLEDLHVVSCPNDYTRISIRNSMRQNLADQSVSQPARQLVSQSTAAAVAVAAAVAAVTVAAVTVAAPGAAFQVFIVFSQEWSSVTTSRLHPDKAINTRARHTDTFKKSNSSQHVLRESIFFIDRERVVFNEA
ncbi:hypothetical protein V1477_017056 [Vespula maculifrons]|uniref:Uncharacterized protein n=1 Tax=Vespula maculifrons TaxID=7453 RepID=A0ABD2B4Z2_VESMC